MKIVKIENLTKDKRTENGLKLLVLVNKYKIIGA